AEGRELRQLLGLGALSDRVEELEDADGRPAERKRRRDGAALRQALGGQRAHLARLRERPLGQLARAGEIGLVLDAVGAADREPRVAALPEDRGPRAGDRRRDAGDLRGGVLL